MQKPPVPRPPSNIPAKTPLPASDPALNKSKSEQRLSKGKGQSSQKRVRLRDYLFVASTSAMRNNEKKKTLKSSVSQKQFLKESINILKKQKYQLPNSQMFTIVKEEIKKDLASIIESLQSRMDVLQNQKIADPSNDDLKYLYHIKRIIGESLQPAVKEINEMSFARTGNVLKEFIEKEIMHRNAITQAINEQDKKPNLFESFLFFTKK